MWLYINRAIIISRYCPVVQLTTTGIPAPVVKHRHARYHTICVTTVCAWDTNQLMHPSQCCADNALVHAVTSYMYTCSPRAISMRLPHSCITQHCMHGCMRCITAHIIATSYSSCIHACTCRLKPACMGQVYG